MAVSDAWPDLLPLADRLADPAFFLLPEFPELLRQMRTQSPVHWCQVWATRGFWAITRYRDIKAVLDDPVTFSSEAAGNIIPADPDFHRTNREAMGFDALPTNTDPPKHLEVRRLFARHFAGPAVARLQPKTQAVIDEILRELQETGSEECNFVLEVAAHLPARLICEILGVPREDWPVITQYANSFASFADPELQLGDTPADTFQMAMTFLFKYMAELVEKRRLDPRDDFASIVAAAEWRGEALPQRDAAWWAFSILAAGFETSRNVIAGGLLALINHPDQWDLLKQDRSLMNRAVDEMVRWTTPATAILRVATRDSVVGGQQIKAGEWLTCWLDSANRDEDVFDDPWIFDVAKRHPANFAFGFGEHNCIGRMLAMLETRLLIETLLDRADRVELTGPVSYISSTIAKGPKVLPVRIRWNHASKHPLPPSQDLIP